MNNQNQISKNIKDIRKAKGYKAIDLAKILDVSKATISQWENGDPPKKIETIRKIAAALEVSVYMLLDTSGTDYSVFDNETIDSLAHITRQDIDHRVTFASSPDSVLTTAERETVLLAFQLLNDEGRHEALKHLELLTQIPDYTKKEKD